MSNHVLPESIYFLRINFINLLTTDLVFFNMTLNIIVIKCDVLHFNINVILFMM